MVGVSASVNLPLHHKVQKLSSGTGSPKKGHKIDVVVVFCAVLCATVVLSAIHTYIYRDLIVHPVHLMDAD